MEEKPETRHDTNIHFYYKRHRLNNLFREATKYPLAVICAGAGYGKTRAVNDFAKEYKVTTLWVQLSESDNVSARFWENYTHTVAQVNMPLAIAMGKLGFPDTREKLNQHNVLLGKYIEIKQRIIIFDDFHFLKEPSIIRFIEECIAVFKSQSGTSLFIITRSTPRINTAGLISRGLMFNISENDLRFTETELAQYFRSLNISVEPDSLREIMKDINGWAFAINLIARSFQKAPGYSGYLRNAMKTNIFQLMEAENWNEISEALRIFLLRLSLIDHLAFDLIELLADKNEALIAEMEKQNAYIHQDCYINAYHIHPLFLEFLKTKQGILTEEQKHETYTIAGNWCKTNGFLIDALTYFEKIGDYESIVTLFFELPTQIPMGAIGVARYLAEICDRTPEDVFYRVGSLAAVHMRSYTCQGLAEKAMELSKKYEEKFQKLPEDNEFKKRALADVYYSQARTRTHISMRDNIYDFDRYFERYVNQISDLPLLRKFPIHYPGLWIVFVGSSREGAPEECIAALTRTAAHISRCFNGRMTGVTELAWGELKFYQGDIHAAEPLIIRSLELAREKKQYGIVFRALFYLLRLAVFQGNYSRAEQALKNMKAQLDEVEYTNRFINYDIALSWYYYILNLPDMTPDWLKESFSFYGFAGFIENFGNQMKARYHYMTRNYLPLLSYIEEMKRRESYLYQRAEMLAIEACIHYKMKDKEKAFAVLKEAYETASPNKLVLPFIELGKDMRTLTGSVLNEISITNDSSIPRSWLENINHSASTYAKRRSHIVTESRQAMGIEEKVVFSPRESDIIIDLSHGLSRKEIASSRNISINTVKTVIKTIYAKAGAENLPELIHFTTERKMI